jgi:hypothetical protein
MATGGGVLCAPDQSPASLGYKFCFCPNNQFTAAMTEVCLSHGLVDQH